MPNLNVGLVAAALMLFCTTNVMAGALTAAQCYNLLQRCELSGGSGSTACADAGLSGTLRTRCNSMCTAAYMEGADSVMVEGYTDVCTLCNAGTYYKPTTINSGACTVCPKGYYMPVANLDTECVKCTGGYTTSSTGSTAVSSCYMCAAGTYEYRGKCELCGMGDYQDEPGQTSCKICEDGYYADGSTDGTYCLECPKLAADVTSLGNSSYDYPAPSMSYDEGLYRSGLDSCYYAANAPIQSISGTFIITEDCWWEL